MKEELSSARDAELDRLRGLVAGSSKRAASTATELKKFEARLVALQGDMEKRCKALELATKKELTKKRGPSSKDKTQARRRHSSY